MLVGKVSRSKGINLVKANVLGAGVSANGKDNSVELISVGGAVLVLGSHLQLARSTLKS